MALCFGGLFCFNNEAPVQLVNLASAENVPDVLGKRKDVGLETILGLNFSFVL